ncbi:lin-41 [Acrasis kona]|uniref:Lin-41 n=1 Tax=Acrasis kona TaxID=1008807 RepID=A0AAW2Z415_9EUKA
MYDLTKTVHSSETFVRSSARPQYDTSDDALVEIASKAENPEKILFITSDRGLIERLKEVGAKVAKPKPWFNVAFSLINKAEQKFDNLNDMLKVIRESTKKKEETDKVE